MPTPSLQPYPRFQTGEGVLIISQKNHDGRVVHVWPAEQGLPQCYLVTISAGRYKPLFLVKEERLRSFPAFGYYGLVFVLPTFLNQHMPHEEEYVGVLLTAIAEIPGYLLGGWLADRIGRRAVLTWSFGASAVMAFVTGAAAWAMESADVGWGWTLVLACVLKTALSSAFLVIMVYTTEAYPTLLTTTSYGFGNAFTRLAGAITPSVGQVLLDSTSSFTTFAVYGIGCALATVLAALLPFETKGRDADAIERARPLSEATPLQPKGAAVA